jgi:hypothetical protein
MTRTARTDAELETLFPRGFGANGIADLHASQYTARAREWALEGDDLVRFYTLAARRHRRTADRAVEESLRLYGTFPAGRMRWSVARRHSNNLELAVELEVMAMRAAR